MNKSHNPLKQNQFIKDEFNDYIRSTFQLKDQQFKANFIDQLKNFDIANGPFLSITLPFVADATIEELIAQGKLEKRFEELIKGPEGNIFKQYRHQIQALNQIQNNRNVVITTGTGSGKTEAFLYPILNEILKEIRLGNKDKGIRAFFLYPLNALINDQMARLRQILKNFPEISFGFFTGETKNKDSKADSNGPSGEKSPENEVTSREQLRENPPHILFTNFSMLEYLLLRPIDQNLLSPESMKYWRFMVLDEAHSYRGSLAIEISYLLKRLVLNAKKQPQFILTSATLGRGNQDLDKIITFASSLTQSNFEEEDIVFATRERLEVSSNAQYFPSEQYMDLLSNIDNLIGFNKIVGFTLTNPDQIPNALGEYLLKDKTLQELILLANTPISFFDLHTRIRKLKPITDQQLVAWIELIAKARLQKTFLLDIKYHMFLRAPEGAYVTLNKDKHFRLINTKFVEGYKAFNIGICEYCKSTYLFGKISQHILEQAEDVDIEENLEEEEKNQLDYFIYPDGLTTLEIQMLEENPDIKKVMICNRCGHLHDPLDLKANSCDCSIREHKTIYAVPSTHQVTHCPVCDNQKNTGIIKSFHIGKDSATSLIAQILYQSFDLNGTVDESLPTKSSDVSELFTKKVAKPVTKEVKQFLAFSDSRQQASYFAKFYDYNDDRFLKKASLLNILKKSGQPIIDMQTLQSELFSLYSSKQMYDQETRDEVLLTILLELLLVDGAKSASKIGLYDFVLTMPELFSKQEFVDHFRLKYQVDLSIENWHKLIRIGLELFRTTPAIAYPPLMIDESRKSDVLGYRQYYNQIAFKLAPSLDKKDKVGIRSFMPVKTKNTMMAYFKKVLNRDESTIEAIWSDLWDALINTNVLQSKLNDMKFRIDISQYQLVDGKHLAWYQCQKCLSLTHMNLNSFCSEGDCPGELKLIQPEILFQDDYYHRQFKNRKIERTIIKEHTAQLSPAQGRAYQLGFADKKINILSSSTTFEMGINLGSLSTVFMRNMPPLPSNYVQRAGRAGRALNTSSLIVTFCNNNSHDFNFFKDPRSMISGNVEPPYFTLNNQKIAIRHIMAYLLAAFFRINPDLMESMGKFIDQDGELKFQNYIQILPQEIKDEINLKLIPDGLRKTMGQDQWLNLALDQTNTLKNMMTSLRDRLAIYQHQVSHPGENKDYGRWAAYNLDLIRKETTVISHLSSFNVIPRYGFPIDNVDLKIYNQNMRKQDDDYRLNRDLSMAISEFAPDSQIIVDKKLYTSRYIILPPEKQLPRGFYAQCPTCLKMNVNEVDPQSLKDCVYCKKPLNSSPASLLQKEFIIPRYGFYTAYQETTSRTIKPKKTYAGEISYVSDGDLLEPIETISPLIKVSKFKHAKLMVLNENSFYMCQECGYTLLKKGLFVPYTQDAKDKHVDHRGKACTSTRLERVNLGHSFLTDVAVIEIDFEINHEQAVSTLYALLEGVSLIAEIERRDINGVLAKKLNRYQFILYDNVPGGAGHTAKLSTQTYLKTILEEAYRVVNQSCCSEETSCYNCLRNYGNTRKHGELSRRNAKYVLTKMLISI
jgi:ATP-dependent helicase YprA (DUF1998 family)/rubrerythrin